MTRFRILILSCAFLFLLITVSCSDDDEDKGPAYEFNDQPLQGKVDNENWIIGSGIAEASFFTDGDLSIELTDITYEAPCDEFILEGLQVFFDIPAEEGLYPLKFSQDGQTITLYNPENSLNVILVDGAVELTSITETEVSGRIDGRSDGDNYVNGNFTVPRCAE